MFSSPLKNQKKIASVLYHQPGRETHILNLLRGREVSLSAVQIFHLSQVTECLQFMPCIPPPSLIFFHTVSPSQSFYM